MYRGLGAMLRNNKLAVNLAALSIDEVEDYRTDMSGSRIL
jgi:hypothetical protein